MSVQLVLGVTAAVTLGAVYVPLGTVYVPPSQSIDNCSSTLPVLNGDTMSAPCVLGAISSTSILLDNGQYPVDCDCC